MACCHHLEYVTECYLSGVNCLDTYAQILKCPDPSAKVSGPECQNFLMTKCLGSEVSEHFGHVLKCPSDTSAPVPKCFGAEVFRV